MYKVVLRNVVAECLSTKVMALVAKTSAVENGAFGLNIKRC